jgi:hypothetical protein
VSVNVGRTAEIPVFLKPFARDATMVPIWPIFPYIMLDETDKTSRITRRTQTVMNTTDINGFTVRDSRLWNGIRAIVMAADHIKTVTSGQNTRMQII